MTQHGDEAPKGARRSAPRSARKSAAKTDPTSEAPVGESPISVRFAMPADHLDAHTVHLVGEFNDWSHTDHPMSRRGNQFVTEVSLAPGLTYRYKFLIDGTRWENDWTADAYVPNEFGGDDSVIDLRGGRPASVDPDAPGAAVDDVVGEVPEPNEPA
jgi:1,4-alpha-glucan branching enzyme